MSGEYYTKAHKRARSAGKKEIKRYSEKFKPLVADYANESINWDSGQRRQFNQDRSNVSTRLGLRSLMKSAGADTNRIIKGGLAGGQVMADATVKGNNVTGWQQLNKLTKSAGQYRSLQNVTDANMERFGSLQSGIAATNSHVKQALSDMKMELAGTVVGAGAGIAAGGWWGGIDTDKVVDGAGGGYGPENIGAINYRDMIRGDLQLLS